MSGGSHPVAHELSGHPATAPNASTGERAIEIPVRRDELLPREVPPKGWQHGCRFTHAWLRLEELGWHVLEEARAELPGNQGPHDRGSSFFLCGAAALGSTSWPGAATPRAGAPPP